MMSWKRLEANLTWLVAALQSDPAASLSSMDESIFPLPYKYGYLRDHATKWIAASCIQRSRDAFLPLMAHCSYLLFWQNSTSKPEIPPTMMIDVSAIAKIKSKNSKGTGKQKEEDTANETPSDKADNRASSSRQLIQVRPEPPVTHWEFVLSKVGTNAAAIAEIKQSELVDFSFEYERVGYLINQSFLSKNSHRNLALRLKSVPV
jgi:hypothetical protein